MRDKSKEEGEVKSAFTYLSGCSPRGKMVEVGLGGGKTGPKIVTALPGGAASHVHGRAARTCRCLSRHHQPRVLAEGPQPHMGSLGFHRLLPLPAAPLRALERGLLEL